MRQIRILHLGVGNVGRQLLQQIKDAEGHLSEQWSTQFLFHGLFTSQRGIVDRNGLSATMALKKLFDNKLSAPYFLEEVVRTMPLPFLLIDTTASDATIAYIKQALRRGGFVVLSNKKPLTGTQEQFDMLHKLSQQRLLYETVVGGGLPVIKTIKEMIDTGDEIVEIQGCLSGTLSFVFSELDKGRRFSEIILDAKKNGFTEPDPRDDLSGKDVARKALILSRIIGRKLELKDIKIVNLYSRKLDSLNIEEFMKQVGVLDKYYQDKIARVKMKNRVFRYVARISHKTCTVGLEEVEASSEIGSLKGSENLIMIKTKRYFKNPLVIKGPGAGIEVTAAGVFANILEIVKTIKYD